LANEEQSTFDVEFALNQFSGNRTLLVKMLDRFFEQHESFSEKLLAYVASDEQKLAKEDVHGLKGVSGNLGMKALHQACREFEDILRQQSISSADTSSFISVINATLERVRQFSQGDNVSSSGQETSPIANNDSETSARQNLLKALERNEFISDRKLSSLISDISMPADKLQQLQVSIDELDYEKAISLLES
jgi:HPt (histidine-containing phosphotransfer) domain-containing protein